MTAPRESASFGRADEDGNVYLLRGGEEHYIGQYPDVPPEQALAYFVRKFDDVAAQIALLEQRAARGATASAIRAGIEAAEKAVAEQSGVGDYDSLTNRLTALRARVADLDHAQHQAQKEAVDEAIHQRESIVAEIEGLAAQPSTSIQWKTTTKRIQELFDAWKTHQRTAPRIPKAQADALWDRFRTARGTLERERRAFYAAVDDRHKAAREAKRALIAQAQALNPADRDAVTSYRALLDKWKAAGRAGGKADDPLWNDFKAAGDRIFAARKEELAHENEEYARNLALKTSLLEEAEALVPVKDAAAARKTLTSIQERWEAIGRVPRESLHSVEERLRRVERQVKSAEDAAWRKSDPTTRERVDGMHQQLIDSIRELEDQLTQARKTADERKIREIEEALSARRSWLAAIEHS